MKKLLIKILFPLVVYIIKIFMIIDARIKIAFIRFNKASDLD